MIFLIILKNHDNRRLDLQNLVEDNIILSEIEENSFRRHNTYIFLITYIHLLRH